MAVTVYDVAAKAGVSFQLAAAVLGGKKYAHASEATRKKIFAAASELDYRSNIAASVLAGGSSKIIGVIIDSRAPETMYRILAEIEQQADQLGYRILTAQAHDNPEKLLDSYRSLKQTGIDGIISFSHDYSNLNCHLDKVLKDDPKIVFVLNTEEQNTSSVDIDFKGGMAAAVKHLRSLGCRKTAQLLVNSKSSGALASSVRKRLDGFRLSCPDGEVFFLQSPSFEASQLESECERLIREKLIPGKFDSAVVVNDFVAGLLVNRLIAENVRVPHDFKVVGCDDLPVGLCCSVRLTTLRYDWKKLARTALELLLDRIAGKNGPVRTVFPMELVIRESTRKNPRHKAE